jgi:nucleoside-diphosphate-sugar epimerase
MSLLILPPEDLEHVLTQTEPLWDELRGQRLFLTGATGFFGKWLMESFVHINARLGLGAQLVGLSRNPHVFASKYPHLAKSPAVTLWRGDVRNFAFPEGTFSHVIHAATEASAKLNTEAPSEMLDTIVSGMQRLLKFNAQAGVQKCLFTSSGAVYGPQPSHIVHVDESFLGGPDPLEPVSAYGEGKRVAEHMGAVASHALGWEWKVARCFAFVGPHLPLNTHFAAGNFILNALEGQPIQVAGDGTAMRSYLHAADLAVWLWTILFRGVTRRAYNVGSFDGVSIADLARAVVEATGSTHGFHIAKTPDPEKPVARYVPGTFRAENELGLKVLIPLHESIRRTFDWYLPQYR